VAPGVSNAHTEGDSECVIFYWPNVPQT
jgi:hypothetical protein